MYQDKLVSLYSRWAKIEPLLSDLHLICQKEVDVCSAFERFLFIFSFIIFRYRGFAFERLCLARMLYTCRQYWVLQFKLNQMLQYVQVVHVSLRSYFFVTYKAKHNYQIKAQKEIKKSKNETQPCSPRQCATKEHQRQ